MTLLSTVFLSTLIVCLATYSGIAQTNVTITSVEDAMIFNNTYPGQSQSRDKNYGTHPRITALAWTYSGSPSYFRSVIRFDLSLIPAGSIIESAVFYLYSDPAMTSGADSNSGSNAFYLEKATQSWTESTVTWNNQPSTTTTDRVWAGPSSSATENRQVDITTIVQQWVDTPSSNYGLKMILENELYYRSRNYASSEHSNTSIRPKLEVTYSLPIYSPISDGNWSDAIWNQDQNATIGVVLPQESMVDVAGHTITLRDTVTVTNLKISAYNSQPGVLIIDGGVLHSNGGVEIDTDHVENEIRMVGAAELTVGPE